MTLAVNYVSLIMYHIFLLLPQNKPDMVYQNTIVNTIILITVDFTLYERFTSLFHQFMNPRTYMIQRSITSM